MFRLSKARSVEPVALRDNLFVTSHSTSRHYIVSDNQGAIHVFSTTGDLLYTINDAGKIVWALGSIFDDSRNGEEALVTGNIQGEIQVYSLLDGTPHASFPIIHNRTIRSFATFNSPTNDNKHLISGEKEGVIVVWDIRTRSAVFTLEGHTATVVSLTVIQDRMLLASGSYDGTVHIWDLQDRSLKFKLQAPKPSQARSSTEAQSQPNTLGDPSEAIYGLIVLGDGRVLYGGMYGMVRVWDSTDGSHVTSWQAHFSQAGDAVGPVLNGMLLHPSGKAFVTTGTDGRANLWDLETYALLRSITPFRKTVVSRAFYNNTLALGGWHSTVLWDLSQLTNGGSQEERWEELDMVPGFVRDFKQCEDRLIVCSQADERTIEVGVWTRQA